MDLYNKMLKAEHALKFTSPRFLPQVELNNDLQDVKSVYSGLSGRSRSRREVMLDAQRRARLVIEKVSQRSDRDKEQPDLALPDISIVNKGSVHNDSGFSFLDRELLDNNDAVASKKPA